MTIDELIDASPEQWEEWGPARVTEYLNSYLCHTRPEQGRKEDEPTKKTKGGGAGFKKPNNQKIPDEIRDLLQRAGVSV